MCNFNDSTLKSVVFRNCLGRYSNFAFSKFSGVSIDNSDFSFAVFQDIQNETLLLDSNNLTKSIFSENQALHLSKLMGIIVK